MKCNECAYGIIQDVGYSSYTVEGTEFHCAKRLHPNAPFDQWYGEENLLNFAETCESFVKGESIHMDVEHYDIVTLSEEQLVIWNMHVNAS